MAENRWGNWGYNPMIFEVVGGPPWRELKFEFRDTKTWEAPFFCEKKTKQLFEAYFPLGKTNMSPENQWSEDVFPIEIVPF